MKTKLGAKLSLYPMPVTLVGADVNGKPNVATIAHVGITDMKSVALSMGKNHYTNEGIRANKTFSVNLPTESQVEVVDYCGLVSGKDEDKAGRFEFFYGSLENAPMVSQCPVNMECRLIKTVDFPTHDLFVGEVMETYADEDCLTGGVLDFSKVRPILFVMNDRSYRKLGEHIATAWSVGKTPKGE